MELSGFLKRVAVRAVIIVAAGAAAIALNPDDEMPVYQVALIGCAFMVAYVVIEILVDIRLRRNPQLIDELIPPEVPPAAHKDGPP
jgi:Na+/serine symporter